MVVECAVADVAGVCATTTTNKERKKVNISIFSRLIAKHREATGGAGKHRKKQEKKRKKCMHFFCRRAAPPPVALQVFFFVDGTLMADGWKKREVALINSSRKSSMMSLHFEFSAVVDTAIETSLD